MSGAIAKANELAAEIENSFIPASLSIRPTPLHTMPQPVPSCGHRPTAKLTFLLQASAPAAPSPALVLISRSKTPALRSSQSNRMNPLSCPPARAVRTRFRGSARALCRKCSIPAYLMRSSASKERMPFLPHVPSRTAKACLSVSPPVLRCTPLSHCPSVRKIRVKPLWHYCRILATATCPLRLSAIKRKKGLLQNRPKKKDRQGSPKRVALPAFLL